MHRYYAFVYKRPFLGGWPGGGRWMAGEVEDSGNACHPQGSRNSKIQSTFLLITIINVSFLHVFTSFEVLHDRI